MNTQQAAPTNAASGRGGGAPPPKNKNAPPPEGGALVAARNELALMQSQFAKALPAHIEVARFIQVCETALQYDGFLASLVMQGKADLRSLCTAAMSAAQLGLLPDPVLGLAYFVPRWDHRLERYKVGLVPGYRGLIQLARNSGEVKNIRATLVYEADFFEYEEGSDHRLVHKPPKFGSARGKVLGAYSIVWYNNGDFDFEPMTLEEINEIRDRSDGYKAYQDKKIKTTPWVTDWKEMAKKTSLRKLSKRMPLSPTLRGFQQAMALEEQAELGHGAKIVDLGSGETDVVIEVPPEDIRTAAGEEGEQQAAAGPDPEKATKAKPKKSTWENAWERTRESMIEEGGESTFITNATLTDILAAASEQGWGLDMVRVTIRRELRWVRPLEELPWMVGDRIRWIFTHFLADKYFSPPWDEEKAPGGIFHEPEIERPATDLPPQQEPQQRSLLGG
jgi:recombination protein RecT